MEEARRVQNAARLAWKRKEPLRMRVRRQNAGEPGEGGPPQGEGQVGRQMQVGILF